MGGWLKPLWSPSSDPRLRVCINILYICRKTQNCREIDHRLSKKKSSSFRGTSLWRLTANCPFSKNEYQHRKYMPQLPGRCIVRGGFRRRPCTENTTITTMEAVYLSQFSRQYDVRREPLTESLGRHCGHGRVVSMTCVYVCVCVCTYNHPKPRCLHSPRMITVRPARIE